ncbi:hypothetical protein ABPG73_008919, partial [Tetrahymena malaccensis]
KNEKKFIEDINLKIGEHLNNQGELLSKLESSNFQQKQEITKLEQIVKNAQIDLQKLNLQ